MLVEFRVKNYRSFRDEQTLSMVASSEKKHSKNCVLDKDIKVLKSTGVYGPNASGKSNLIKAIGVLQDMVIASADYSESKGLPIVPFRLDKNNIDEPSEFEVIFVHDNIRYQYGFSANNTTIFEEWLYATPKNRAQLWFYRTYNKKKEKSEFKFGSLLKGDKNKYMEHINNNTLFLSKAASTNNQLLQVFKWFKYHLILITTSDGGLQSTAKMLLPLDEPNEAIISIQEKIKHIVKSADLGIEDVIVSKIDIKDIIKDIELDKDGSEKIKRAFIEGLVKNPPLAIFFGHRTINKDNMKYFSMDDESEGTKRFFELIGPWVLASLKGITIVVDELERSLHPLLARSLIKLIHNKDFNANKAQLIFATHDTTLLDSEILRRDQILLVEKNNVGESILIPLSDYKPRKDEAIQRGYLSGRYGAIPVLEEFESIEKKYRKPRKAKDFGKEIGFREHKKFVLIICEGEKTEPQYFEQLRKEMHISPDSIIIEGKDCGSAPISVVEYAISKQKAASESSNQANYDIFWCVMDVESPRQHESLVRALNKAMPKNNIKVALSNPCFEYWYLLHFKKQAPTNQTNKQMLRLLQEEIPSYKKNDIGTFNLVYDKTDSAIKYSKELLSERCIDTEIIDCDPSTNVHELVEYILNYNNKDSLGL